MISASRDGAIPNHVKSNYTVTKFIGAAMFLKSCMTAWWIMCRTRKDSLTKISSMRILCPHKVLCSVGKSWQSGSMYWLPTSVGSEIMFFGVDRWQGEIYPGAPRLPRVEATRAGAGQGTLVPKGWLEQSRDGRSRCRNCGSVARGRPRLIHHPSRVYGKAGALIRMRGL